MSATRAGRMRGVVLANLLSDPKRREPLGSQADLDTRRQGIAEHQPGREWWRTRRSLGCRVDERLQEKLTTDRRRRRRESRAITADITLMISNAGHAAQRRANRIRAGVIKRGQRSSR